MQYANRFGKIEIINTVKHYFKVMFSLIVVFIPIAVEHPELLQLFPTKIAALIPTVSTLITMYQEYKKGE